MKRFMALLLAFFILCGGSAVSDAATPTDLEEELVEIDDEDWGEVSITFERRVYISMDKEPQYLGDTMTLTATLVDFQDDDVYTIYWQYSSNQIDWNNVDGEHTQSFTITIDATNYMNWWRVLVQLED